MLPFQPHLKSVLAVDFRQVVRQLNGRTDLIGGQKGVAAQSSQATDSERRKPAVLFCLRYVLNTILGGDIAEIARNRSGTGGMQVIQPGARNVHQVRREDVRVGKCALLRERCLIALLESAAICHPAENTWDELGIIYIAESIKRLIPLAEINVQPRIERIAVFVQLRRVCKIREQRRIGRARIQIQQLDRVRIQAPRRKLV